MDSIFRGSEFFLSAPTSHICMYRLAEVHIFEIRTVVMKMMKDMERTHAHDFSRLFMYITFIP